MTAKLEDFPAPPPGAVFSLARVQTITRPHTYMIGARHVVFAADHASGMLSAETIRRAEDAGIHCEICNKQRHYLTYDEHVSEDVLLIAIPEHMTDLMLVPGLHAYLLSIKDDAERLGITGFGFPPSSLLGD
jgi:hypothetical protein